MDAQVKVNPRKLVSKKPPAVTENIPISDELQSANKPIVASKDYTSYYIAAAAILAVGGVYYYHVKNPVVKEIVKEIIKESPQKLDENIKQKDRKF